MHPSAHRDTLEQAVTFLPREVQATLRLTSRRQHAACETCTLEKLLRGAVRIWDDNVISVSTETSEVLELLVWCGLHRFCQEVLERFNVVPIVIVPPNIAEVLQQGTNVFALHSMALSATWLEDGVHLWTACVLKRCGCDDNVDVWKSSSWNALRPGLCAFSQVPQMLDVSEQPFSVDRLRSLSLSSVVPSNLKSSQVKLPIIRIFGITQKLHHERNSDMEAVCYRCFERCERLHSVDLSGCTELRHIETGAFYECRELTTVNLADMTKLESLREQCFWNCKRLKTVMLGGCTALSSIGGEVFFGCSDLQDVNLSDLCSLRTIGDCCWAGCNSIKEVKLVGCRRLVSIGNDAFEGCRSLTSVDFSGCLALESLGGGCFYRCVSLTKIDLSACLSFKSIRARAFQDCDNLTGVVWNCGTLGTVGGYGFSGCASLRSVSLSQCPALESLYCCAFQRCSSLVELKLSCLPQLQVIPVKCFESCSNLESVEISDCPVLSTIYRGAFCSCQVLKLCSMINLPQLVVVECECFQNCHREIVVTVVGCARLNYCKDWTCDVPKLLVGGDGPSEQDNQEPKKGWWQKLLHSCR